MDQADGRTGPHAEEAWHPPVTELMNNDIAPAEREDATPRCEVTGNPVGTDTWEVGHPCQCRPCRVYVLTLEALEEDAELWRELSQR